jgi:hypothetical protein
MVTVSAVSGCTSEVYPLAGANAVVVDGSGTDAMQYASAVIVASEVFLLVPRTAQPLPDLYESVRSTLMVLVFPPPLITVVPTGHVAVEVRFPPGGSVIEAGAVTGDFVGALGAAAPADPPTRSAPVRTRAVPAPISVRFGASKLRCARVMA